MSKVTKKVLAKKLGQWEKVKSDKRKERVKIRLFAPVANISFRWYLDGLIKIIEDFMKGMLPVVRDIMMTYPDLHKDILKRVCHYVLNINKFDDKSIVLLRKHYDNMIQEHMADLAEVNKVCRLAKLVCFKDYSKEENAYRLSLKMVELWKLQRDLSSTDDNVKESAKIWRQEMIDELDPLDHENSAKRVYAMISSCSVFNNYHYMQGIGWLIKTKDKSWHEHGVEIRALFTALHYLEIGCEDAMDYEITLARHSRARENPPGPINKWDMSFTARVGRAQNQKGHPFYRGVLEDAGYDGIPMDLDINMSDTVGYQGVISMGSGYWHNLKAEKEANFSRAGDVYYMDDKLFIQRNIPLVLDRREPPTNIDVHMEVCKKHDIYESKYRKKGRFKYYVSEDVQEPIWFLETTRYFVINDFDHLPSRRHAGAEGNMIKHSIVDPKATVHFKKRNPQVYASSRLLSGERFNYRLIAIMPPSYEEPVVYAVAGIEQFKWALHQKGPFMNSNGKYTNYCDKVAIVIHGDFKKKALELMGFFDKKRKVVLIEESLVNSI